MVQLIGLLLPPLIDLVNYLGSKITDSFLSSQFRFWVSFIVCAVIGLAIDYFITNGVGFGDQNEIAMSILSVFAASQISYKVVWENTNAHEQISPRQD